MTRHPVVYEAITPLARIASCGAAGVDPHTFGIGPVQAAHTALHRAGITWANLAAVELNEAFAAQSVRPALRALLGDPRQERSQ